MRASGEGWLIQAAWGSLGAWGRRLPIRCGWVAWAASRVAWRWARISAAVPKWTDAGV